MFITGMLAVINFSINSGFTFAQEPLDPSKVRTAYLYHFMRFIDWPVQANPQADDPYIICIPAESSELVFLEEITKKTVNDNPISIMQVDNTASLQNCHILYLVDLKPNASKRYINDTNGLPVLSVGNGLNFLGLGGMISFNVSKGQVTFSVNLKAATEVNLKISANMLDVAEKVIK